ncbi:Regulator of RpoS [subsurface metagenome]
MVDLYVKEIKEKGLIIKPLREQKIFLEEKEKIIQEELPKPISVEPSISEQSEERRIINRRYKIILADGSPIIKKIVNLAFSKEDYEIHTISDGQEVIKSLEQINPDIILLDINLPKKNGYEVCEFVKNNSKLVQTPIIILRGTFEKIDQEKIKKLACNDFIQKPFNSTELVQKVKNILEKRKTAVTSP